MFQSLLSGLRGTRESSVPPTVPHRAENGEPRSTDGIPGTTQFSGVLDALTKGVQQLQELQAQAMQKGESSPEGVRQTIPAFPALKLPVGDQSGLQLQDWLDLVSSNVADVSENSASWWEQVTDFVQGKYNLWLSRAAPRWSEFS